MNTTNLLKLPIKSVAFLITQPTIICTICYWNPILQRYCKITDSAKCHPDDTFNIKKGEHIAESRAKARMYYSYAKLADNLQNDILIKYDKLFSREQKHVKKLIHEV